MCFQIVDKVYKTLDCLEARSSRRAETERPQRIQKYVRGFGFSNNEEIRVCQQSKTCLSLSDIFARISKGLQFLFQIIPQHIKVNTPLLLQNKRNCLTLNCEYSPFKFSSVTKEFILI